MKTAIKNIIDSFLFYSTTCSLGITFLILAAIMFGVSYLEFISDVVQETLYVTSTFVGILGVIAIIVGFAISAYKENSYEIGTFFEDLFYIYDVKSEPQGDFSPYNTKEEWETYKSLQKERGSDILEYAILWGKLMQTEMARKGLRKPTKSIILSCNIAAGNKIGDFDNEYYARNVLIWEWKYGKQVAKAYFSSKKLKEAGYNR